MGSGKNAPLIAGGVIARSTAAKSMPREHRPEAEDAPSPGVFAAGCVRQCCDTLCADRRHRKRQLFHVAGQTIQHISKPKIVRPRASRIMRQDDQPDRRIPRRMQKASQSQHIGRRRRDPRRDFVRQSKLPERIALHHKLVATAIPCPARSSRDTRRPCNKGRKSPAA